jgi:hypothetical protein
MFQMNKRNILFYVLIILGSSELHHEKVTDDIDF